ncbi:mobile mystery protein B [Alcanivorax sp. JB21]|uniref:mobile mystery protein B n=1 Tax=Alcanivorax limicola TaxID=2874102 RepID=UPI001CBD0DEE|nr:mobile mystery protein B [Alcanivorax limicola]MBZ2189028.1 mobile mystery protein B [Alcanivorax limicola]
MSHFDTPYGATPLDPSEIEGLKIKNVTTRGQLDQLEAAGVSAGLLWLKRRKHLDTLSDDFLRELHRRLFAKVWAWAGTYRTTEKNIGIDPSHIAVQVRELVDNARFWIDHSTYGRIEFAARFHHQLVKIHPFPNGNGRLARIATNGILSNAMGMPPVVWARGKAHAIEDNAQRRAYINALRSADGRDIRPLIHYLESNEP